MKHFTSRHKESFDSQEKEENDLNTCAPYIIKSLKNFARTPHERAGSRPTGEAEEGEATKREYEEWKQKTECVA